MSDDRSNTTDFTPCREGHERCAVDGVECECEQREEAKIHSKRDWLSWLELMRDEGVQQ